MNIDLYYSWYSICSEKVLICLIEKELEFVGHHIDLFDFAQVDPEYLLVNPNGNVPTLLVNGKAVFESTIINEFLDESYPHKPLAPDCAFARAEMRRWVLRFQEIVFPAAAMLSQGAFIADELRRRWNPEQLEKKIREKQGKAKIERQLRAIRIGFSAEELNAAEERICQVLDELEEALSDGREWLVKSFSLAEAAAAPNVYRLTLLKRQDLLDSRPNVLRWSQKLLRRPSIVKTYEYAPSFIEDKKG